MKTMTLRIGIESETEPILLPQDHFYAPSKAQSFYKIEAKLAP